MADQSLTTTSYVILGLVRTLQPCTSYEMKSLVKISIGMFWSFPHSQLYAEPMRLVEKGMLTENQETTGRKRRLFRMTPEGDSALDKWLRQPTSAPTELRDIGQLRLFFSDGLTTDEVRDLALAREKMHRDRYDELVATREKVASAATPAKLRTMEIGFKWEETAAEFWASVAADPPVGG